MEQLTNRAPNWNFSGLIRTLRTDLNEKEYKIYSLGKVCKDSNINPAFGRYLVEKKLIFSESFGIGTLKRYKLADAFKQVTVDRLIRMYSQMYKDAREKLTKNQKPEPTKAKPTTVKESSKGAKKDYWGFIHELRRSLNTNTFTTFSVRQLAKRYKLRPTYANLLVDKGYLVQQLDTTGFTRSYQFKLTSKAFGLIATDLLAMAREAENYRVKDQVNVKPEKDNYSIYDVNIKLGQEAMEDFVGFSKPLEDLTVTKFPGPDGIPTQGYFEPAPLPESAKQSIEEFSAPLFEAPALKGLNKNFESSWNIDGEAYSVKISVSGPVNADLTDVLNKGLVLANVTI